MTILTEISSMKMPPAKVRKPYQPPIINASTIKTISPMPKKAYMQIFKKFLQRIAFPPYLLNYFHDGFAAL
jgi:hypothetical protein